MNLEIERLLDKRDELIFNDINDIQKNILNDSEIQSHKSSN